MAEQESMIAVIQIRGTVGVDKDVRETLDMLNLQKKHNCVIIHKTPPYLGMLKKVKDYVTWGEVAADTIKSLEKMTKKNKTFLLPPPKGGFERGGIKKPFNAGGVLGDRKEKMNDLIRRMVQ